MGKSRFLLLTASHTLAAAAGFALGIYALPILIAPPAPDSEAVAAAMVDSVFIGEFSRDRTDSDALHWGEGEIAIGTDSIAFSGHLAPGPDYRLYLSPHFVETEAEFNRLKPTMVEVAAIKTFDNFIVELPKHIDPANYSAAIIWCETFGQFISSASYHQASP